ncbi:MAG: hypothetical protein JKY48_00710 [Flavobacteriales bacterium]|nr:hypothetical protein [Flavobacteriales bacterium]
MMSNTVAEPEVKATSSSIDQKQAKFHMQCEYKGPQTLNVTLIGITGTLPSYGKYYVACYQGDEIGTKPKFFKMIEGDSTQSWTIDFADLNMDKFSYTIALGLGGSLNEGNLSTNGQYFPVSVNIPLDPERQSGKTYSSDPSSETSVLLTNQASNSLSLSCNVPNGNAIGPFPQFVVLKNGAISNWFYQNDPKDMLATVKIQDIQNVSIPLSNQNPLRIGNTYSIAYIMGYGTEYDPTDRNTPNLKRLAAWTEFVAK